MKKIILVLFFLILNLSSQPLFAKEDIKRGDLISLKTPKEISTFVDNNGLLHLKNIRDLCKFLVDDEQSILIKKRKKAKKLLLKKRKNAFKRHVKTKCEEIENSYLLKEKVSKKHNEIILELMMFKQSIISKAKSDYQGVTLVNKVNMKISGMLSPFKNVYLKRLKPRKKEAGNIEFQIQETVFSLSEKDPVDSPFWHKTSQDDELSKNFKKLEKSKKIKIRKNMVVLFDKPSLDGSAPKIKTLDLDLDNGWTLKWGDEVHTDVLGSRIFAAFGYDVDHPYFFGKNKVTLVFPKSGLYKKVEDLKRVILKSYNVDLSKFVSNSGVVSTEMAQENPELNDFVGQYFVQFYKCSLEARPDRVKRIGHMGTNVFLNPNRRELRGSTLLHMWIGNWDTREENTMLSNIHMGKHKYRPSAVFNDLGTSFGIHVNSFPTDFKAGLVNKFSYNLAYNSRDLLGRKVIRFNHNFNYFNKAFNKSTYTDLRWMALKLAKLNSTTLKKMIKKAQWPNPIAELYYHKLASRRFEILKVFNIVDPNPMKFTKKANIHYKNKKVVKNGELIREIDSQNNPEGFLHTHGRFRNYGGSKR